MTVKEGPELVKFNVINPFTAFLAKELSLTQDQREVVSYGLQVLIYSSIGFASILTAGWLLGCFWTTFTAMVATACLRVVSGGAHSKTPLTCGILGVIIGPSLGKIAVFGGEVLASDTLLILLTVGFLVSIHLIWRLAPVDSPAKPISSEDKRARMRLISVAVLCFITAVQIVILYMVLKSHQLVLAASLGVWWQVFMLTRSAHRFTTFFDDLKERRWTG
jgi:accessory gene regulator B